MAGRRGNSLVCLYHETDIFRLTKVSKTIDRLKGRREMKNNSQPKTHQSIEIIKRLSSPCIQIRPTELRLDIDLFCCLSVCLYFIHRLSFFSVLSCRSDLICFALFIATCNIHSTCPYPRLLTAALSRAACPIFPLLKSPASQLRGRIREGKENSLK